MLHSIACVSFLNSKPLIDPVLARPDVSVHFAVPADLLSLFDAGTVSAALMSVVDFQTSRSDLLLLPAGMIGCDGPTLTVRIFSRIPPEKIRNLHGDTDSHTSLLLAQLILRERYGTSPNLLPLPPQDSRLKSQDSLLLIGDKVVNASPDPAQYPYQLDLGEEWKALTGLPFVFAMWMIRKDRIASQGADLARILNDARQQGATQTEQLLDHHAQQKGWPRDLARQYFTQYLRYQVTPQARQGLARFFELATRHNLLPNNRPIAYFEIPA